MKSDIEILHQKLLEILLDFDSFCRENDIKYTIAYGTVIGSLRHIGFIPWDDDIDVVMTYENYMKFLNLYKNNDKYFLQRDTKDYPLQFSKLRMNNTTFIEKIPYKSKYKKIHQGIYIDIICLDAVSNNKISFMLQRIYSNIIISQSLFLRGYYTASMKKKFIMVLSALLIPFRKKMIRYIKKFNGKDDCVNCCDFFACIRKHVFPKKYFSDLVQKGVFESYEVPIPYDSDKYLTEIYGDWRTVPSVEQQEKKVHAQIFKIDEDYTNYLK